MNLPLCVSELIKNSLDASSKSIIIRINKSKNVIQIIDNGSGISEEQLNNIWKVNKNISRQSTYGKNNEFLKQIINLSDEVIIESFMPGFKQSFVKCFKKNQCYDHFERQTPSRLNAGTTITIRNIKLSSSSDQDIKIIIETVKEFSILHYDVSFSLRDHSDSKIIFGCKRTLDLLDRLKLTFNIKDSTIEQISCRKDHTIVNLFICSQLHSLSNMQYIFINKIRFLNRELTKFVNNTLLTVLKVIDRSLSKPVYLLQIEFSQSNYDLQEFDMIVKNCIMKCAQILKEKLTNKVEVMDLVAENLEMLPKASIKTRLDRCKNWLNTIAPTYEVNELDFVSQRLEISPAPNFQLSNENVIPSIINKLNTPPSSRSAIPIPELKYFPGENSKELVKCSAENKIEYLVKNEEIKLETSEVLETDKKFNDLRMKKVGTEFQKFFKMSKAYKTKTVKSVIDDKKNKIVKNTVNKPIKNIVLAQDQKVEPKLHQRSEIGSIRTIPKVGSYSPKWNNTFINEIIKSPEKSFKFDETQFSSTRKNNRPSDEFMFSSNRSRKTDVSLAKPIPVRITERVSTPLPPSQHITYNINSNCTMNIYTNCPPWLGAIGAQNQLLPSMFNNVKNEEPSKIYEL